MKPKASCPTCGAPLAPGAPQGLCPACLLQAGVRTGPSVPQPGSAPFIPPTPAELASHFPQLEIIELIGHGGMGAVYRARQPNLDRVIALKILRPQADRDPGFAERFTHEARALAKLNHPNIVAVHDFGQSGGYHYLVMEFVGGVTLRHLLQSGRISAREALAIVPPICDALQYAHDRGIVHRDIKPENILLDKNGVVKIADFGLAKIVGDGAAELALTGAGDVMGTPHYMAPEQVEHPRDVDHRADIYSLGVVFYQMLTGELPLGRFAAPSRKVLIDVRLDEVVLRALEKDRDLRYQQASVLKTEVETIATSPALAPEKSTAGKVRTAALALIATHLLNLILLVTLFGMSLWRSAASVRVRPEVTTIGNALAEARLSEIGVLMALLIAPAIAASAFALWAAIRLRNLRGYRTGAAAAAISTITPLTLPIGIVTGIWMLLVLHGADVRALFAATRKTSISSRDWRLPILGAIAAVLLLVYGGPIAAYRLGYFAIAPGAFGGKSPAATPPSVPQARAIYSRDGSTMRRASQPATSSSSSINPYGISVRLFSQKSLWQLGETPLLRVEIRTASGALAVSFSPQRSILQLDDTVFNTRNANGENIPLLGGGGVDYQIFLLRLDRGWITPNGTIPRLAPGRHRVAYEAKFESSEGRTAFVASAETQIEIGSRKADTTPEPQVPRQPLEPTPNSDFFPSPFMPAARPIPSDAGFALPNFDSLDSNPEILRIQIRQAEIDRDDFETKRSLGIATDSDVQSAGDRVDLLQAKLKGDRVRFAQLRLSAAERRYAELEARYHTGTVRGVDVEAAKNAITVEQARLRAETETANAGPSRR